MSKLEELKARIEGHTPGPWEIAADLLTWEAEEGEFYLGPADAPTAATARSLVDAELITAAPQLLAALEAVLHLHQESDGDYRDFTDQLWQGKHCEACRDEWPCDTAEAITEALA